MRASSVAIGLILLLIQTFMPSTGFAAEPRPAITIRAVRPDRQLEEVISLFRGAKAPHPAAALSAWKRASREPNRLGKPLEALIAALNPQMVGELKTLDEAEVAIWFEPDDSRVAWGAWLPRDDGTFAALASALVLSGGAADEPLGELAVDRLGGPASPLMARGPRSLLVAGDRNGLEIARRRSEGPSVAVNSDGLRLFVEPRALAGSRSLGVRMLAEALRPGSGLIVAQARLVDARLAAMAFLDGPTLVGSAAVEPGWLDWVPANRATAAFALAADLKAGGWDALIELTDRVERVDPARVDVAPLRLRLDLLARTVGLRTEVDVWPHLDGISGWIGSDGKILDAGLLALHLDDEAVADRLASRLRPLPTSGPAPAPEPGDVRWLGRFDGRPLRLARVGRTVALAWGTGSLEESIAARDHPDRSAGAALRRSWTRRPPATAGGLWPSRVPGLVPEDLPLARTLSEAPPIVWDGSWSVGSRTQFRVSWDGLDAMTRRFLELIPNDPPPDR